MLRLLEEHAPDLAARTGAPLELAGVAVRRVDVPRRVDIPPHLITDDAHALVTRSDVDIVIELIGGIEPARELLTAALRSGKSVVTANKALLAEHGPSLYKAASEAGVDIYFEAAVAGAIPLLRSIQVSLAGDRINRVMCIVNGTTNYILTKMDESGADRSDALAEATRLGYAEADPTADVEGYDAASKAAILGSLAFHTRVASESVFRRGITAVTAEEVADARDLGYVIKLLAIAERSESATGPALSVRVHPTLIPRTHPLASVREAFNAVFIEAEAAGQLMLYGPGAGGAPTASAVMGDVVTAARHVVEGSIGPGESAYADIEVLPMDATITQYYLRIDVADETGVLASIARVFADRGVSIATVRQEGQGEDATLKVMTHRAVEADLAAVVGDLRDHRSVRSVSSVLRVHGSET